MIENIVIPDSLSFQKATTMGVGICTVGQALYQRMRLDLPTSPISKPEPSLIYGGSTATGALAIQYAKMSGYEVLTTCWPHNFEMVKALGTDAVYNYHDLESANAIRDYTKDGLNLGGEYMALLNVNIAREKVNDRWMLAYNCIGEKLVLGNLPFPASAEDKKFGERFSDLLQNLLADGKVRAHRFKIGGQGLKGVLEGLQLMKEGKVSKEKLVYNVAETP